MARNERQGITACNDNVEHPAPSRRDESFSAAEVGNLEFAGQLVVWGIRSWVRALKSETEFDIVTEGTFARFGLTASATAIDRMMTLLAASASRMIDIRCTPCRYLSPDELILIDAVAAAQQDGYFLATVGLRKMVPGTAARGMLPHLVDFARDLGAAGMCVQPVKADAIAQAQALLEAQAVEQAAREPRPALLH